MLIPLGLLVVGKPTLASYSIGLTIAIIGQLIRIWSAGYLHKQEEVTACGPFAYVRNPLYVGTLVMGLGYCIISAQWWAFIVAYILYLGIHWPTILSEENYLSNKFGEEYIRYCHAVPRLIPRLTPCREFPSAAFSRDLLMENHEYRSMIGMVLLAVLFGLKLVFKF